MNKHTAQLPDGNIATRNSKSRVYSHAVIVGPRRAQAIIARNEKAIAYQTSQLVKYSATATALETAPIEEKDGFWTSPVIGGGYAIAWPHQNVTTVEEAREMGIAKYRKFASDTAENITELSVANRELAAGPELVGEWSALSWSSRADLAQKEASRFLANDPYGSEVRVVEAVIL